MKLYLIASALLIFGFFSSFSFQDPTLEESMQRGSKLYKSKCAVCHKKDGTGRGKNFPPIAVSDYLMNNPTESIKGIKYGLNQPITVNGIVYDKEMKAVELSDAEIADVMNFISNSWGNTSDKLFTGEFVKSIESK